MNEMEHAVHDEKLNPLSSIWTQPKKTICYVIKHKSISYVILLLSICTIGSLCTGLIDSELYPHIPIWGIIALLLILSPVVGILTNTIYAFVFMLFGKLFNGIATFTDLFKALSLVYIPYVILIPFYLIWMIVDSKSLFYPNFADSIAFPLFVLFLTFIVFIWSFVLSIIAVAVTHNISYWKAILSILIPSVLLSILMFIIILIFILIIIIIGVSFS
ncbi:YIP1 family protein [Ureibacillus sp. NPDC094379]